MEVVPGDEWVTWAFEEEARKTGLDMIGCVMYWRAASAVVDLYQRIGDRERSRYFNDQARLIQSSLQSANSPLWDAADGMYYAAGGQNRQIDILASALAVHCGLPTAGQQAAISQWLARNYASISHDGYVLDTPESWQVVGYIQATKTPYRASPFGIKSYQSAYWSVGNQWISEALYLSSPPLACRMLPLGFYCESRSHQPSTTHLSGNPKHGFSQ